MQKSAGGRLAVHWGVLAVGAAVIVGVTLMRPAPAAPAPPPAPPRCEGLPIALTFDDGPSRTHSRALAGMLAREDVSATFFVTGRSVTERPGMVRRFARDGHRIYNHTYDHINLTAVSDDEIRRQITRTEAALDAVGVRHGPVLRPPYGAINRRVRTVVRGMGFTPVKWTVDTHDWRDSRTADEIVRSVRQGLEPRASILLHDTEDTDATMEAMPRIIRMVRNRGYCFGVINHRGRVVRTTRPG